MNKAFLAVVLTLCVSACVKTQTRPDMASDWLSESTSDAVKYIGIYVQPYYVSGKTADETPTVRVAAKYDSLLSSTKLEDIKEARDNIASAPELITPMTLMVLSIRLYDVGLRDESVFWFYVAKDRYSTLADVLEIRSPSLAQVEDATRNFAVLAGPVINGYAFCSLEKQKALRMKAFEWVERNPYKAIFIEQLPAKPGDRATNLRAALDNIRSNISKEQDYFSDRNNVEQFIETRRRNNVPSKYCWR